MNHITKYIFAILSLIMLAGCSESEKDEVRPMDTLAPISLTLSVPADKTNTRIGDPGTDTNDMVDWDRLTIIVAYKKKTQGDEIIDGAPKKMVYYDTYTKEEFDRKTLVTHATSTLSGPDANGFRTYTMYLPLGTCCVYGVTYSNGEGLNLEEMLNQIEHNGQDHNSDIYNLQISNDYAHKNGAIDVAKFISVATGYALKLDPKTDILTKDRDIKVEQNINANINTKQYWRMVLGRLAAKIDIQWDAKGAYEKDEDGKHKFTDVKVQGFTYHGEPEEAESTILGSGKGRLFPTLYYQKVTSRTPVSGHTFFVNTSEISKRNGRVYHYTFPDGTAKPRITFDIKTKKDGATEEKSDKVTFDLKNRTESFNPAQWYKINVTISGAKIGNASNIIIDNF